MILQVLYEANQHTLDCLHQIEGGYWQCCCLCVWWSQFNPSTKETWRWLSNSVIVCVCCLVMCMYYMLLEWALIILSIFEI